MTSSLETLGKAGVRFTCRWLPYSYPRQNFDCQVGTCAAELAALLKFMRVSIPVFGSILCANVTKDRGILGLQHGNELRCANVC